MGPSPPEVESGPPKMMEKVIAILIPPACREEIVGDLHERYHDRRQYCMEALLTLPLVIYSRIRRTTCPGVLLLEGLALYLAFSASALYTGQFQVLMEQAGYLKLAAPMLAALLSMVVVDAYAGAVTRLFLGPVLAFAILLSSGVHSTNTELAFPSFRMILFGSMVGMLLVTALRLLFAPGDHRPTGAS